MFQRTCLEPGCDSPQFDRGRCREHILRHLVNIGRSKGSRPRQKSRAWPTARAGTGLAWLKAHRAHDGDDCLIFPCGNNPANGVVTLNFKTTKASRAMCFLAHGRPPEGKTWALHRCGNGHLGCVNPRHLYWGDASDNAKDTHRHRLDGKPCVTADGIPVLVRGRARDARKILAAQHNAEQAKT